MIASQVGAISCRRARFTDVSTFPDLRIPRLLVKYVEANTNGRMIDSVAQVVLHFAGSK